MKAEWLKVSCIECALSQKLIICSEACKKCLSLQRSIDSVWDTLLTKSD